MNDLIAVSYTHLDVYKRQGERYFGEKVDENHYRINVANMKRAKTYSADVYVGESLITRIDVTTKGKSASVNSDFDDLF